MPPSLPRLRLADLVRHAGRAARSTPATAPGGPTLREVAGFGPNPGNLGLFCHIPDRLPAGAPLVVVLHGCKQDAASYVHGTGWATLADRHGFAVLAPEQRGGNNAGACFNWFDPADQARNGGEAESIRAMVAHLVAEHRLDPKRVFVTGLSAGGAMTAVMLATYPEVFAAGAVIAGLPYGVAATIPEAFEAMRGDRRRPDDALAALVRTASRHAGAWPRVAIWHGAADHTVDPANAAALVGQWRALHGLADAPSEQTLTPGHVRRQWRGADGVARVEQHAIEGLGHGVPIAAGDGPDRCGTPGPFILEAGISSSQAIAAFFGIAPAVANRAAGNARTRVIEVDTAGNARPAGPESSVADRAEAAWVGGASIAGDAIRRALAAAGLMRR